MAKAKTDSANMKKWLASNSIEVALTDEERESRPIRFRIVTDHPDYKDGDTFIPVLQTSTGYVETVEDVKRDLPTVLKAFKTDEEETEVSVGDWVGTYYTAKPARFEVDCHVFTEEQVTALAAMIKAFKPAKAAKK